MDEVISAIVTGIVVLAALVVLATFGEVRFFYRMRPLLPKGEDLPLFNALYFRAIYVAVVGAYLLVLTLIGSFGVQVATYFPWVRVINALLLLGLVAGPVQVGHELRRRTKAKHGDELLSN